MTQEFTNWLQNNHRRPIGAGINNGSGLKYYEYPKVKKRFFRLHQALYVQ